MKHVIIILTAWLLAAPVVLHAQSSPSQRPVKKLIEYGWDVPYPDQVRKDIRNMEKKPFDGVIFRLREWNHAFDPRPWDEAQLKPQFDDLAAIEWKTFTDNFLCLYAANNWKMDWFDDEQWKNITANLRLSAKAAKIGRCVGLVFDPEPYGDNPWAYPGMNENRTFAEVEAQVHKRGAQFMTALQTELPNVRLLTFFHQSLFAGLPRAMTRRILYRSGMSSTLRSGSRWMEPMMKPPSPFSTAPSRMVWAAIPWSELMVWQACESPRTTIYADGRSPWVGPGQSVRYPAHARRSKILAFLSGSHEST